MVATLSPPVPTVAAMQLRFPEFAATDAALIQLALDEAAVFINGISMKAAAIGQMYLAAHIMALNQFAADNDGLDISGETIGRISIHYRGPWMKDADGDLMTTVYGRRFKALRELGIKKFVTIRGDGNRYGLAGDYFWYW